MTTTLSAPSRPPAPNAAPTARTLPASPAQEQLWFLDQRHAGRAVNNLPVALNIDGPLDATVLAEALNDVVARHEIFRTRLDCVDGRIVQVVVPALTIPVPVIDLRLLPAGAREAQAFRLAREEAARPFDPRRLPLVRAQLYLFEECRRILVLTLHRAVFDHESLAILLRELAACYEARRHATLPQLPALSLQYSDYAARQGGQAADLSWWRARLEGGPAPLRLPADRPVTAGGGQGRCERLDLPTSLHGAVESLARRTGTNAFTILLAAFQALLHRETAQVDFLIGVGLSDRQEPETAGLVGLLTKVVPFRARLAGDPAFRTLLDQVRADALETYAHSLVPFERLAGATAARDAASSPVQFFHEGNVTEAVGWPGLALTELELDSGGCACELSFHVVERADRLSVRAEYDADRFTPATIQRLLGHFGVLLQAAVSRPQSRVSELPLLTAPERRRLLGEWNNTFTDFPRDATITELLATQAAATPDAVAVEAGSRRLIWRELERRSNQFARHLRALGHRPGQPVGLCVDHSPQLLVALVGTWKAGGTALLLDPARPASHLSRLVREVQPTLVFAEAALRHLLPADLARILLFEAEAIDIRHADDSSLVALAGPDDLACVFATAGHGGEPKPVELTHRALVGAVHALRRATRIAPDDVLLATAPLSSIELVTEFFLPLVFGARVVLAQPADLAEPARLAGLVLASGATLMIGTPSSWQRLLDTGWTGSRGLRVFLTGEPVPEGLARRLAACCREAWNLYGAVETAGVGLAAPLDPEHANGLLGRPLPNVQVHVLDHRLQPVPVGVAGELFVGGDTLAQGYCHRDEATAANFVPDPFRHIPGARLFRTGDLGRRVPNGEIEFLGRRDRAAAPTVSLVPTPAAVPA
jgi:amino acid adenylation domain-containing protein